ncbi:hypothetical protein pb186bvf_009722 [Paramecium bursaria]
MSHPYDYDNLYNQKCVSDFNPFLPTSILKYEYHIVNYANKPIIFSYITTQIPFLQQSPITTQDRIKQAKPIITFIMKPQQLSHLLLEETLLQVDLRTEQLKSYLEKMTSTVNSHTNYLNNLQIQINSAVKQADYEQHITRTADSISLKNAEFHQQVQFMLEKPLPENTEDHIENAFSKLINKEKLMGNGMAFLYQRAKDWESRLNLLENDLKKRSTKDEVQNGLKEQKNKIQDLIDAQGKKHTKSIQDLERQILQNKNQLQASLNDTEQKTLWKITDCEKLLQIRINDKFVESSCQATYDRVFRDLAKQKDEGLKGLQNELADLKAKIQYFDESNNDKLTGLRNQIKEINDQLNNKYCTIEKHEQSRQILNDRTIDLQNKVGELMRKVDAVLALEKLIPTIKQLEDSCAANHHRGEINMKDIEELKILFDQQGINAGGKRSDIDPHKMCQLESDVKRLKGDVQDLDQRERMLDTELKRKIDGSEQRLMQQLNLLRQNQKEGTVTKEEVIQIIDKELATPMSLLRSRIIQILNSLLGDGSSFEVVIRTIISDIADLKKKMDQMVDLERRVKQKFKQMTSNETVDFMKQIQQKADEEDTKAKFAGVDEKYKSLVDNYNNLLKTIAELEEFINYLQSLLHVNQQETLSILTGNHRVVTQKCLVCGNKNKLTKQADKSGDYSQAKLYRGDFRPNQQTAYENQEVYEMNPNQVTLVQESQKYVGTTVGYKYPVISYKERQDNGASSSGRQLRPASAQPKK